MNRVAARLYEAARLIAASNHKPSWFKKHFDEIGQQILARFSDDQLRAAEAELQQHNIVDLLTTVKRGIYENGFESDPVKWPFSSTTIDVLDFTHKLLNEERHDDEVQQIIEQTTDQTGD